MKIALSLACLAISVAAPVAAAQHAASDPPRVMPDTLLRGDQIAVAQTVRAVFAAAERKDIAALDTLYAGDSLTVVEGAGINRGWADYRDTHLGPELREVRNFRYRPFEIMVRTSGSLAWATFRYALGGDLPQQKLDHVGRGTAILERQGNRWVVRHTHMASRPRRPNDPAMP